MSEIPQSQPIQHLPETIQTRQEHSRSLEDAEKLKAIHFLKEVGLLKSLNDIDTYHGRVDYVESQEEWRVNPWFKNGGNDTGNRNVHSRPTLYTGSREVADKFARSRMVAAADSSWSLRQEIHDIVSDDPDATILDNSFNSQRLDSTKKEKYHNALKTLLIGVTEGSPVEFEKRDDALPVIAKIAELKKGIVTSDDIKQLSVDNRFDLELCKQMAGAYNARQYAQIHPEYLVDLLLKTDQKRINVSIEQGDQTLKFPINIEYVERYLRNAHVVGVSQLLNSATLSETIKAVSFFDLEKVNTRNAIRQQRELSRRKLGGVATLLGNVDKAEPYPTSKLLQLIKENKYARPESIVEAAKQVEGYRSVFDADAGNWEGYTLAQHTETVLRNFDENFADKIPAELLSTMRLALVAHDIGKPIAHAKGEKHRQHEYNSVYANDFLTRVGISDKQRGILLAIIGEGADLSYKLNVKGGGEEVAQKMQRLATDTLRKYSQEEVTKQQVNGFIEMCNMLQLCDGGAYTSMAVTRDERRGIKYRNAPSFNRSFMPSIGLGKRDIKFLSRPSKHTSKT